MAGPRVATTPTAYLRRWQQTLNALVRKVRTVRGVEGRRELLEARLRERNLELVGLNARLADELAKSAHLSDVLRRLTTSGDGAWGNGYFRHLVRHLTELFGADHAIVAVLNGDRPGWCTTLAAYSDGDWLDEAPWELDGTPCADLVTSGHLVVPHGLTARYPATLSRGMPADSYVGVLLRDPHGDAIGMVAVMNREELPDSLLALQLLDLMATRTSTEIQRMRAEQHLRRLSEVDELTGLRNRSSFLTELDEGLRHASEQGKRLAVLFFDLDNFKIVNDSLGHDVGDELLAMVGRRIQQCFQGSEVVARLGGDEFAAVVPAANDARLGALCQHIGARFVSPFFCRDHELYLSVSIGVSRFPQDGTDTRTLLRTADIAMYQAKERGKNQLRFYSRTITATAQDDLTMATRLRRALIEQQFQVFYQPQVDTLTRRVIGAEALLRWTDPDLGEISPLVFIPIAQRTGSMDELGDLVVSTTASYIRAWQSEGLVVPPIAVNVSPSQLRDRRFAARVADQLRTYGVQPSMLTIELTEDALMLHSGTGLSTLDALTGQGLRISIDDFGTGYSSLAYLRSMPIQEVKIDRTFIHRLAEHPDDRAIAAAIVSLAFTLGLDVVAEGVETEQQLDALIGLGCTTAQGFLFHRPMPAQDFRVLLHAQDIETSAEVRK